MTSSTGRKLQGVGLALAAVLAGCATHRHGRPGAYALDVDSVSATTRHQPSLITRVAGEEQVVNPSWLGWSAAAAVATANAIVTVVQLTPRQRADFEQALQRCAQQAERDVNREAFGSERSPRPDECYEIVGTDKHGKTRIRAQEWGALKHAKALECVKREVLPRLPSELARTFVPDIVIIDGTPFRIRAVYDFKFPCVRLEQIPEWGKNPNGTVLGDISQEKLYEKTLKVFPQRITPQKVEPFQ